MKIKYTPPIVPIPTYVKIKPLQKETIESFLKRGGKIKTDLKNDIPKGIFNQKIR